MKKTITRISLATLLAASFGAPISVAQAYAASASAGYVTQGMSGQQVTRLQTELQTLGYFTYPTITGYFGSITAQSVQSYQRDYSLPATGTVNTATQSSVEHALVKKQMMIDSKDYIGVPYAWGGSSPSVGFDCSGFVYYLFKSHGIPSVRTTSGDLFTQGAPVSRANLRPGDLVFFSIGTPGVVSHVGFFLGGNQFISATRSAGIYIQSLDSSYWGPRYLGARRVY